ncbi:cobalt-zinc-cadmium efflux system protein [Pullulanibacillus pueri]|uniref:Cadmium, cobalt and zinc/H(+)-K(+) antiporter n=1 Tax=Pullulanibacillus pueri TaxID=1437324 RepID=A0A8J3EN19_9BACL|nr:cation diffusion facilitator family transporter [Pullulanibacillus pueri]MBM7683711.1 cobalt-zinc-cadmium efflux system protein [Pullulanibacillus pueri]GGH85198.1 cadmium, cobalt and zinc/H(+)-K(+) antiporter [Pullulanibacillus pueri]
MAHSHGHDHGHDHTHHANKKALLISFILTAAFMIAEAIGGFLSHSLALLSDAGHMLSDAVSLAVGLAAFIFGEKLATGSKTFGYKRFEILAALFNGVVLIVISIIIIVEAFDRFFSSTHVNGTDMLWIAVLGLIINIVVAWILMRGDTSENLNLKAAFLHVIGDLLGSVGAIIASLLILFFDWNWADPVASILVSVLILVSGWRVTRQSIHVLMEGTPSGIELQDVVEAVQSVKGVKNIHDLHVWSISSGINALSCHVVLEGDRDSLIKSQEILQDIEHTLLHKGIGHTTIQIETADHDHEDSILCSIQDDEGKHHHHHH